MKKPRFFEIFGGLRLYRKRSGFFEKKNIFRGFLRATPSSGFFEILGTKNKVQVPVRKKYEIFRQKEFRHVLFEL